MYKNSHAQKSEKGEEQPGDEPKIIARKSRYGPDTAIYAIHYKKPTLNPLKNSCFLSLTAFIFKLIS